MTDTKAEYFHGMDRESLAWSFQDHVRHTLAKSRFTTTDFDRFNAAALVVRDRLIERWIRTQNTYYDLDVKRVYYLSMEFLIGRTLANAAINLGLYDDLRRALQSLNVDLDTLLEIEWDAGLGNGGLGRLAACFLDSMATLELPCYGYGIRYEYGIFHQRIKDGYQVESPDNWLRYGNPWEIPRPQSLYPVHFYGRLLQYKDRHGQTVSEWLDTTEVLAMAYDTPIPGYQNNTVNTLRLWSAKATREFDLRDFNEGDYIQAVRAKNESETISKVLYPNDNRVSGKVLRLKQEYFFVSATLQDILRRYKKAHSTFDQFADKTAIQLNDTHPAIAIAELMRLLVDEEKMDWDRAWSITQRCFGYTNHTVMPEALERWSVDLMRSVLPRLLNVIYEINFRFMNQIRLQFPNDEARCVRMSVIEEPSRSCPEQSVRMAHLAIIGSHKINGVSALHSEILKRDLFKDFFEAFPDRFTNKTNGITQRRWLKACNPWLSDLITATIGDEWGKDLDRLRQLADHKEDAGFRHEWREARNHAKHYLAKVIKHECEVLIDPHSLIDTHVKRIHDYKRQLMNALHVIALYNAIRENPNGDHAPRTVLFGGKAAPGYTRAKLTIKFINDVAEVVNNDPAVRGLLKVVFVPNYNVTLAEKMIPGTDLSEQISQAGTEASGTGNMKFALNGALTIGTLDGANIELRNEIGADNMFIFGLTAEEVAAERYAYNPRHWYGADERLRHVLDMVMGGYFSPLHREMHNPLITFLLNEDPYMVLRDFGSYVECQQRVANEHRDIENWTRKSILNVAGSGYFSSDRTIREYADEVWSAASVPVPTVTTD